MSRASRRSALCLSLALASACAPQSREPDAEPIREPLLARYPSPECIPPLPEGPIWLSALEIAPSMGIELEPGAHHLIQFRHAPSEDDVKALAELGVQLLEDAPERAFWARLDAKAQIKEPGALPMAGGIAQAFPVRAQMKLHPTLIGGKSQDAWTAAVHWFSDASAAVRKKLESFKVKVVHRVGRTDIVTGSVATLVELAQLEDVQFVEPYVLESRVHSRAGELAHNASAIYAPPYDITGSGLAVAVFDSGWADFDHPDLAGRVFHDPMLLSWRGTPFAGTSLDVKTSHATAMTGIIASSGAGEPAARGTVPAVNVYSYRVAYEYFEPDSMVASQSQLYGWRVSNHSYGKGFPCDPPNEEPCKSDPRWSSYLPDARSTDLWATEHGVLSVYSAGNDGLMKEGAYPDYLHDNWQTIHSGGIAKNAISVCAAAPTDRPDIEFTVKGDSSKGPASDGRVKPDLCALGQPWWMERTLTTELGGGYRETYATSPASAEVAGAAVALHEQYARMFPDSTLPPALAKGLLIHSARDMHENTGRWNGSLGRYDTAHTEVGPDYTTGWGFMDLGAAFERLTARTWRADTVALGRQNDYTIQSVAPGEEVRVTLIWDDAPASPGVSRALSSNLDLRVTNLTTGEVQFPFVLNPIDPMAPATRGVNSRDNVEQVRFVHDGPKEAAFLIEVVATHIPRRAQRYFVIANHAFAPPRVVIDEYRLRRIVEANAIARLSCQGLFLRGPDLELSRRLTVTLPDGKQSITTPFTRVETTRELHVVPRGVAPEGAVKHWEKLHALLKQTDGAGVVLTQKRDFTIDGGSPIGVQLRAFEKAPDRLELSTADVTP